MIIEKIKMVPLEIRIAAIVAFVLMLIWWGLRRDYRFMKSIYKGHYIPRLSWVKYGKRASYDYVSWGKTRYRFMRKDFKKDNRYANNYLIPYPSKLVCGGFTIWIPRLEQAKKCFNSLQYRMNLRMQDIPFRGEIVYKNDPFEFFNYNKVEYIRWCLKLLEWCGYEVTVGDYNKVHGICTFKGKLYYVYCYTKREKMPLGRVKQLYELPSGATWILISIYGFTGQARNECIRQDYLCMDLRSLILTPKYEKPMFL